MKRATAWDGADKVNPLNFNPRPREEGDFNTDRQTAKLFIYFNPRPREEGDKPRLNRGFVPRDFNPRPREEGD